MPWHEIFLGVFGFMALAIAGWVARSIDKMKDSLESLNIKIAIIITRQDGHEVRITKLEEK